MADLTNTIKTALAKYPEAFPTERGLEVRHPNGTLELLVFYRGLDQHEAFGVKKEEEVQVEPEVEAKSPEDQEVVADEQPKKRGRKPKEEVQVEQE